MPLTLGTWGGMGCLRICYENTVDSDMFQNCFISSLSFSYWPRWYVLFMRKHRLGLQWSQFPGYQNCHQTHFQPLSCTGEMLEAKLRQQVQAHMWGLGVGASWIIWLIMLTCYKLNFAWWTVSTVDSDLFCFLVGEHLAFQVCLDKLEMTKSGTCMTHPCHMMCNLMVRENSHQFW